MSLFAWFRPAVSLLSAEQQQRRDRLPAFTELNESSLREQRWVVVDVELSLIHI